MNENTKGAHEWFIEFEKRPENQLEFNEELDRALQTINSDYEAKRYKNITLNPPKILVLEDGSFYRWMKNKGKLGGQNKVPRLCNNRKYLDEIQQFLQS
jgi:hypothetical protein